MPGIVALVSAISDNVVAALSTAGYPALTDGKVLLGAQHVYEQSSPPRVVFIPRGSKFQPKAVYNRSNVSGFPSDEWQLQLLERSIGTDAITFEVHVWGAATTPDPDNDFDSTQILAHQVIRSIHDLIPGSYTLSDGIWADQRPSQGQLVKFGHEYVFGLTVGTPILGELDAAPHTAGAPTGYPVLTYAPSDVTLSGKSQLDPGDGSPVETSCQKA